LLPRGNFPLSFPHCISWDTQFVGSRDILFPVIEYSPLRAGKGLGGKVRNSQPIFTGGKVRLALFTFPGGNWGHPRSLHFFAPFPILRGAENFTVFRVWGPAMCALGVMGRRCPAAYMPLSGDTVCYSLLCCPPHVWVGPSLRLGCTEPLSFPRPNIGGGHFPRPPLGAEGSRGTVNRERTRSSPQMLGHTGRRFHTYTPWRGGGEHTTGGCYTSEGHSPRGKSRGPASVEHTTRGTIKSAKLT